MGMPVKTPAVSVDGAEDAHFKPTLSCRVEQIIDGQAADVIESMAVVKEERPEGVGQGEHQVLPGAIGQTVILVSDPLIGGLLAAGRASPAVAGVAQVLAWQAGHQADACRAGADNYDIATDGGSPVLFGHCLLPF